MGGGQAEVEEDNVESRRRRSSVHGRQRGGGSWKQMLLCCIKPEEDDVKELDYQHSSLTDVPAEVFNHERTLEVLRLDCNQIVELPRPLFHCHGLKELYLSDNEISTMPPALASLIHLQVLDVSKNALAEVPDSISGLKALITLDLSINPLGKLPEGATKLLALESLNLSDTFLEFLPANFGRLTKLRHLELRENQLASLPKSMSRLTSLRRLDLGQNELSDVPEVVGSIPSLTELWLDGNKLDVLPDLLGQLPNLVHLDASRNSLHGIAPSIGLCKSLTDLSLTSNNLAALPDELGDLSQLTILRVDDNRLAALPDSIGRLTHLEELQAGQNRLSKLPASIGLLRQLGTLMLNENQLEELPAELGSCQRLTVLSVRKNRLERLPPELGQLSRLRVINVSCNRLPHLPVSLLKLQPTLAALWLSEAQTKPVVPLQTDTDPGTGHKVLTCFLLPQSETVETPESEKENSSPAVSVAARSPTHIKFAFDGEADHRAGRLMRNPTPYPKELKALAKHAQHIQQHHPVSPTGRNSAEPPPVERKLSPSPSDVSSPSIPAVVVTPNPVEPSVAVVSKLASSTSPPGLNEPAAVPPVVMRPKVEARMTPPPAPVALPESPESPITPRLLEEPKYPAPILVAQSPLSNRVASVENILAEPEESPPPPPPKPQPPAAEIEIKEARVLRPPKSSVDEEKTMTPEQPQPVADTKPIPPPYHVAAAYSKLAAEFQQPSPLPRTQSTDSGFTVDGSAGSKAAGIPAAETEMVRDSSPGRDSGRGPSIEPLEEAAVPPPPPAQQAPLKRPIDLPLNGLQQLDGAEKITPLMIKRATFIVESASSPPAGSDETGDLQSVAALRQAAREVFLASPKQSPLPSHKPQTWDAQHGHSGSNGGGSNAFPLSAANVVGLPSNAAPLKVAGRLPPPKYHMPGSIGSNGSGTPSSEQLKSPLATGSSSATSRIPRLPSGLTRQTSGLTDPEPAPLLPPKQQPADLPPSLLPKGSGTSTSRIPPPQVHTPVMSPPHGRTSFSPLPVHSARLVTPTNNNDESLPLNKSTTTPTPTTTTAASSRIPPPKYSASDIKVPLVSGPSPVSRIPTRLPTPTSALPRSKVAPADTTSPALSPRIQ